MQKQDGVSVELVAIGIF